MREVDQDAIIELYDDENNELQFEHLLTFEYDDELFVAFTPIEDMDDYRVGEVLIMRLKQGDTDEDTYLPIDSQEELDVLWEVFQELYYDDEADDAVEIVEVAEEDDSNS